MTARSPGPVMVLVGIVLVAASLRAGITAVGPLVEDIRDALGLSAAGIGLLTTLPLIAFAVISPVASPAAGRFGMARVLVGAMLLITGGLVLRSAADAVAWVLFGTFVFGAGIAAGNVLLPAVVKEAFPERGGELTSLYLTVLVAFAGIGAAVAVPIAETGVGWRGALGCWAVISGLAALVWLPRARHAGRVRVPGADPLRMPLRSGLAWWLTVYMGLQSLLFYGLIAWLPELLREEGMSAAAGGVMVGIMNLASLAATITVPILAGRRRDQRSLVVWSTAICAIGFAGLMVAPRSGAVLWSSLLGIGTGATFALALMFLIVRARDTAATSALSGMVQSGGYAIAAVGPPVLGALHDAGGGWELPLVAFLAVTAGTLATGLVSGADRVVG